MVRVSPAAALPFGVYCVLGNFESLSRNASVDPQLSVFLARDAAKAEIAAVEARLKGAGGVSAVRFVSRDAALVELNRVAGMQEVIASLPQNPLPDAFVVTLSGSDPALADRLECHRYHRGGQDGQSQVRARPGTRQRAGRERAEPGCFSRAASRTCSRRSAPGSAA